MVHCILFDITDSKRRSKVIKWLDRISVRKQKSVFFSKLEEEEVMSVITDEIVPIIDMKTDIVSVYPVNNSSMGNSVVLGLQGSMVTTGGCNEVDRTEVSLIL